MTQDRCGQTQERMPDVAAGTEVWSAEDAAHLASCESCALEWPIVSAARRLGSEAAGQINPTDLAVRVVAGVRREEKRSRWRRASWVSGLAAAALVVLVVRTTIPLGGPSVDSTAIAVVESPSEAIPMAELEALDAEQLQAVLEQLDAAAGSAEGGGVPRMGDLDDQQLESVLRSLEG